MRSSSSLSPAQESIHALPKWIGHNKRVTFEHDGSKTVGHLQLHDGKWKFALRDGSSPTNLHNLGFTYQSLLNNQLLLPGCNKSFLPAAAAAHVSIQGLTLDCPDSIIKALNPSFANRAIWHQSYIEKFNGLLQLQ
eukprot:2655916-Ditylum_brightwellii.AAC.1